MFHVDGLLLNPEDIFTEIFKEVLRENVGAHLPPVPWTITLCDRGSQHLLQWAGSLDSPGIFSQKAVEQEKRFQACKALPGRQFAREPKAGTVKLRKLASYDSYHRHGGSLSLLPNENFEQVRIVEASRFLSQHIRDRKGVIHTSCEPDPYIYTRTQNRINTPCSKDEKKPDGKRKEDEDTKPEECPGFEDSIAGVAAERAAAMRVCWAPHRKVRSVRRDFEQEILAGKTVEVENVLLQLGEEMQG
ncbi:MAG: hypothetical protein LQ345_005699 [Seirophora villosa]|nr:MAG: hypothetical protein LQ345_005699 [Seirophora villosa]